VDKIRESMGRWLRTTTAKAGEAGKNGLSLGEVNVCDLAAVAPVPAECRPLEAGRLRVEEKKDELQRIR
jgi:hypothetical protein